MAGLCRDCYHHEAQQPARTRRCPSCSSPRWITHPELDQLTIAHMDCDAFYASVEKRDNPDLKDKPVIVGGGKRGVVAACCYIARTFGIKSAMPMFKALKACPEAVVIGPNMEKYSAVSRQIKSLFAQVTPAFEPLSLDEAFIDLTGTERLHKATAAQTLAKLAGTIEDQVGITASIGLSHNKFLAKIASDLDKPRGFAIIGRAETDSFLESQPVSIIWGVGAALLKALNGKGIRTIGDLKRVDEAVLIARHGVMGKRLYHLARGEDRRPVEPVSVMKSISSETTFESNLGRREDLEPILWRLVEKLSARMKAKAMSGTTLTLKLKTASFRQRTRSRKLERPTQAAHEIFTLAMGLLEGELGADKFRLMGVGLSGLVPQSEQAVSDLLDFGDGERQRRSAAEDAMDVLRDKFGTAAIYKGRGIKR